MNPKAEMQGHLFHQLCKSVESKLLGAIVKGNLKKIISLFDQHADVIKKSFYLNNFVLVMSSSHGQLHIVRYMIETIGLDPNSCDASGIYPIGLAVASGHLDVVQYLIQCNAGVNVRDARGICPLLAAKTPEIAEALIKAGAEIDAMDEEGNTAVFMASLNDRPKVLQVLITAGAKLDISTKKGYTPFISAAINGHIEIMKILKAAGVDVNERFHGENPDDRCNALHLAITAENFEVTECLLSMGADFEAIYPQFSLTPLMIAAKKNSNSILSLLLSKKVNLEARSVCGSTPLMEAAHCGTLTNVKALIKARALVNAESYAQHTALTAALSRKPLDLEIISCLLEHGAEISVKTPMGTRANLSMISQGLVEVLKLFLKHHIAAAAGNTLLENEFIDFIFKIALLKNQSVIFKFLLSVERYAKRFQEIRQDLFLYMLEKGSAEGVGLLLEYKCIDLDGVLPITGITLNGMPCSQSVAKQVTPLMIAASSGHIGVVRELLKVKVNIDAVVNLKPESKSEKDISSDSFEELKEKEEDQNINQVESKFTALMWAHFCGEIEVAEFLLARKIIKELNEFINKNIKQMAVIQKFVNYLCEIFISSEPRFDEYGNMWIDIKELKNIRGIPASIKDKEGTIHIPLSIIIETIKSIIEKNNGKTISDYSIFDAPFWSTVCAASDVEILDPDTVPFKNDERFDEAEALETELNEKTKYFEFTIEALRRKVSKRLSVLEDLSTKILKFLQEKESLQIQSQLKPAVLSQAGSYEDDPNLKAKLHSFTEEIEELGINAEKLLKESESQCSSRCTEIRIKIAAQALTQAEQQIEDIDPGSEIKVLCERLDPYLDRFAKIERNLDDMRQKLNKDIKGKKKALISAKKEEVRDKKLKKEEQTKSKEKAKEQKRIVEEEAEYRARMQIESEDHKKRLALIRKKKQEKREALELEQKLKKEAQIIVVSGIDQMEPAESHLEQSDRSGSLSFTAGAAHKKKKTQRRIPMPLTIGTKSALSEFMGYREEVFELSQILHCINSQESREPALTIGKILKRRNALLGICAQSMEILQKFKEGVLPIPPKVAKEFRDVLYHVCHLYPATTSPVSEQIGFYGSVKDMANKILCYYFELISDNNSSLKLNSLYQEMIQSPLFQKIISLNSDGMCLKERKRTLEQVFMPHKDEKLPVEICEFQRAQMFSEIALYEIESQENPHIMGYAENFALGRIGVAAKLIKRDHPEKFANNPTLFNREISQGVRCRHWKSNFKEKMDRSSLQAGPMQGEGEIFRREQSSAVTGLVTRQELKNDKNKAEPRVTFAADQKRNTQMSLHALAGITVSGSAGAPPRVPAKTKDGKKA